MVAVETGRAGEATQSGAPSGTRRWNSSLAEARGMAVTMVLLGFGLTAGNVIVMTMLPKLVPGRMLGRFGGAAQSASSRLAPE